MNYGISILFRAIPLLMALFCFGYGAFVLHEGLDSAKFVAGPVVFSLGMICIALFATAATIIRQIIHTYNPIARYALPVIGYLAAVLTVIYGWNYMHEAATASNFVAGHVICGVGFITACVATTATAPPLHPHSRQLGTYRPATTCRCIQFLPGIYPDSSCHPYGSNGMDMGLLAIVKKQRAQCILCSRPCHGRTCLYLFQLGGAGCNHRPPDTQQLYKG